MLATTRPPSRRLRWQHGKGYTLTLDGHRFCPPLFLFGFLRILCDSFISCFKTLYGWRTAVRNSLTFLLLLDRDGCEWRIGVSRCAWFCWREKIRLLRTFAANVDDRSPTGFRLRWQEATVPGASCKAARFTNVYVPGLEDSEFRSLELPIIVFVDKNLGVPALPGLVTTASSHPFRSFLHHLFPVTSNASAYPT